jgi:hypothetical protein
MKTDIESLLRDISNRMDKIYKEMNGTYPLDFTSQEILRSEYHTLTAIKNRLTTILTKEEPK